MAHENDLDLRCISVCTWVSDGHEQKACDQRAFVEDFVPCRLTVAHENDLDLVCMQCDVCVCARMYVYKCVCVFLHIYTKCLC